MKIIQVLAIVFLVSIIGGCCGVGSIQDLKTITLPSARTPAATIYLIGDAGEVSGSATVLRQVKQDIDTMLDSSATQPEIGIIFLGDNIYPEGLREQDLAAIDAQLGILYNMPVKGWFVPGNHDWAREGPEGFTRILAQGAYINSVVENSGGKINAELLPSGGRPGPAVRNIGDLVTVVFLDSQWWLHTYSRGVTVEDAQKMRTAAVDSLHSILTKAGDTPVIIAAHHPLRTRGEHNKNTWYDRFFLTRHQDTNDKLYRSYIHDLHSVFQSFENNPQIYAAGHDHSLQVFDGAPDYVSGVTLVSGSGSKLTKVSHDSDLHFFAGKGNAEKGFMRVNVYDDKSLDIMVFTENNDGSSDGHLYQPAALRYIWPNP